LKNTKRAAAVAKAIHENEKQEEQIDFDINSQLQNTCTQVCA
jgi:hypothetical protein